MGIDIFLYAERYIDGQWQFLGEMLDNKYDADGKNPYYPADLHDERNYGLFAILSGINNDLEEPFEPIASLRGIPPDLSPELISWYASFQDDEMYLHPGWLTLEELASFDWYGKRRKEYAIVDRRVAHLFHPERSFPVHDWPEDMVIRYSTTSKERANAVWTETYAEAAGSVFMQLLDKFVQEYGVSSEIRFVFWFA